MTDVNLSSFEQLLGYKQSHTLWISGFLPREPWDVSGREQPLPFSNKSHGFETDGGDPKKTSVSFHPSRKAQKPAYYVVSLEHGAAYQQSLLKSSLFQCSRKTWQFEERSDFIS